VAVIIGGAPTTLLKAAVARPWISVADGKKVTPLMHRPNRDDLYLLREYFESGRVVPVVDRRYSLSELPEALQYLGEGRARGKIVISV
jgi:NADPH:quinone reductase-like Zn-dependent oxidoreductase